MAGLLKKADKGLSTWTRLKSLVSISSITLFLVILLIYAVTQTIQQGSPEPVVKEIGKRAAGLTSELDKQSLKIVEQKGAFEPITSPRGFWNFLGVYSYIFALLYGIWIYVKIFALTAEKTFSSTQSPFKNYAFGFIAFILLQTLFLLVFDPNPNKLELLVQPILSFIHLAQAFPYFISPIGEALKTAEQKVLNWSNLTNANLQ